MIVADTGALIALFDRSDRHHEAIRRLYDDNPTGGCCRGPSCPRSTTSPPRTSDSGPRTLAGGPLVGRVHCRVGPAEDLAAAERLCRRYKSLRIGLVDGVVAAVAERLRASAIATLDLKHFGAITIKGRPRLLPRDA